MKKERQQKEEHGRHSELIRTNVYSGENGSGESGMKDKILRGINRMKDSDELDVYIDTLEKTLERCDIAEDNYLYSSKWMYQEYIFHYWKKVTWIIPITRHSSIAC